MKRTQRARAATAPAPEAGPFEVYEPGQLPERHRDDRLQTRLRQFARLLGGDPEVRAAS